MTAAQQSSTSNPFATPLGGDQTVHGAVSLMRAEGHAEDHLFPSTKQLLPGNATGRVDQGGATARFNEDPTQRPLGGRWDDDFSRDRRRGDGGMSPYDNLLGGRLQYDDDDQDGQVCTLQDSSEHVACHAGTTEGLLHHTWSMLALLAFCRFVVAPWCRTTSSRIQTHVCSHATSAGLLLQWPPCCSSLVCKPCDTAQQYYAFGACSGNVQCSEAAT